MICSVSLCQLYIGDGNHTHFIRILWEVIKYTRHSELAPGKCSINVSCWCWRCFFLPLWLTSLVVEQTFRKQRKWSVVKGLVWVSAGPFTKVIRGNLPDPYWVFCFLIFHWDQRVMPSLWKVPTWVNGDDRCKAVKLCSDGRNYKTHYSYPCSASEPRLFHRLLGNFISIPRTHFLQPLDFAGIDLNIHFLRLHSPVPPTPTCCPRVPVSHNPI